MGLLNDDYSPYGTSANNRYPANVFKCPSHRTSFWGTTYNNVPLVAYIGYAQLMLPGANENWWTSHPPRKISQTESMSSKPFTSVIAGDTIRYRWGGTGDWYPHSGVAYYTWYSHHLNNGFGLYDPSHDKSNLTGTGTNNLHVDGHVEWVKGPDVKNSCWGVSGANYY